MAPDSPGRARALAGSPERAHHAADRPRTKNAGRLRPSEMRTAGARAPPMNLNAELPDAQDDRFVRSSLALVVSNVVSAVLGVVFWAVAAHLYPARLVGYGVAEIAAMTFLGSIALLNLGTVFPRFLYPSGAKAGVVLRTGYLASTSIALVAGVVFLTATGHHPFMPQGIGASLLFLGAVILWVVFTIEDAALVGLRAAVWVPVENISFSVAKILLLPVFAAFAARAGVFNSWIAPVVVCVICVNLYLFRRALPAHLERSEGRGVLPAPRVIRSVVMGEYVGGLSFVAMTSLPALIVESRLGPEQAAYFQTPWLAGTSFDMLLFAVAMPLIVEASVRPSSATATVRRAVRLAPLFFVPGLVVLEVGAPYFLRILGPAYAANGTQLLRLVALALPFMAVNVLYVTYARLARRVRRVLSTQVCIAALVLTLTVLLLGHFGIAGVGLAFLGGQGVVSVVVFPSVYRQYRHPDMVPSHLGGSTMVARSSSPAVEPTATPEGLPGDAGAPVEVRGSFVPAASRMKMFRRRPRGSRSVR